MDDTEISTPPNVEVVKNKLPPKSKATYEKEYNTFNLWCRRNSFQNITENVILSYFEEMSKTKKAPTLWAYYSMLRACLNIYRHVDISEFTRLQEFLKRLSKGYQPKRSRILEASHIDLFLNAADDLAYLSVKIVLIMGYAGACSRHELTRMSVNDIDYKDDTIIVSIPKTNTGVPRKFLITEELWVLLVKKYANLRPIGIETKRFFLTYRSGRCISSPIGINKMGQVPRIIATFLKLPNPKQYTGHCFRRSSASQLANRGSRLMTIKTLGGWKSSPVAKGHIEDSSMKKEVAEMLIPVSPQMSSFFPTNNIKVNHLEGDTSYNQHVSFNANDFHVSDESITDEASVSSNVAGPSGSPTGSEVPPLVPLKEDPKRRIPSLSSRPKKRCSEVDEAEDKLLLEATKILREGCNSNATDPYLSYGINIGNELRKYDQHTLAYVKQAINNIIFEADVGNFSQNKQV